jgi:succinyl-CoA synthetase beta subunit
VALDELQAKQLATRFGIAVPDGEASQDAENAVRIACRLGWPVVAKALDPSLAHKSEIGGVVLGLTTPDEVRTSAERLLGLAPQVLIEQQVPPGIEILVTARRDGVVPTLTVGLGGIWTEALGDVVVIPLPAEGRWVRSALSRLRGASVLTGSRGQEQTDLDGLCLLAERVGTMLLEEGLDLVEANPVILRSMSAVAVDLLVR